ncbi:primosomal protein N' [Chakrabartyella piscis]|uniref:primosomal protein N' n=1 Tax=Chakrabartyella piscis TaxID=2918914 RepID=UPI002958A030|nr:primosomal protein N' [Chakrabartyella piscis]
MKIAKIIVGINTQEIDRVFDYMVPSYLEHRVFVGSRVIVPFGRRNVKTEGYVLSFSEESEVAESKLKSVLEITEDAKPMFSEQMISLALWMQKRYFCTLNQCLQMMMPAGIRTKSKFFVALLKDVDVSEYKGLELEVLQKLQEGTTDVSELEKEVSGAKNALYALEKQGVLAIRQSMKRNAFQKFKKYISLSPDAEGVDIIFQKAEKDKRYVGQKDLILALDGEGSMEVSQLEQMGFSKSSYKTLLQKGILLEETTEARRVVFSLKTVEKTHPFQPTEEQKYVLEQIELERKQSEKTPILLHGVTGSGKTEVYLQTISRVLAEGKQAIVLVPEISLTPQILERFLSRFGSLVSVTHSKLSQAERLDQWKMARDGEISVMIGPRSALFTPFSNLGVVIVDEAHEQTYQSDTTPRYDAREVALELAKQQNALVLMGSATHEIAMYQKAKEGMYRLLEMKERTAGGILPQMQILDMRKELGEGNWSPFGRELQEAIRVKLAKKEQVILFLNRRGHSTFVSCRSCGHVMMCEDCNAPYTYHEKDGSLRCHKCGKSEPSPKICPKCESKYIRYFGTGTQKLEEEARKLFPEARILRMDLDTTTQKGSHQKILETFQKGKADILIGTQLVAKGHDFPNVTLVGIMAADLSLYVGGYAASERTFQIITQSGGRAGRSEKKGQVFIQTYQPEHYAVQFAAKQDYKGFFTEESMFRQMMSYPPFAEYLAVEVVDETKENVAFALGKLEGIVAEYNTTNAFFAMGLTQPMISYFRGEYKTKVLFQGDDEGELEAFVLTIVEALQKEMKQNKKHIWIHMTRRI